MSEPLTANSKPKPKPQPAPSSASSKRPSPEEIQAIREARALKKANQQEQLEKAKAEALLHGQNGTSHLDKHGKQLYQPREWVRVKGCEEEKRGVRVVSWK